MKFDDFLLRMSLRHTNVARSSEIWLWQKNFRLLGGRTALWNWFETVTCLFRGRSSLTRAQNSKSRVKIALPRELWPSGSKFWLSKPNFWQQPAVYGSVKAWKGLKAAKTIEIQVKIPLKSKFRLFGSKFWQLRLPGANFLTLVGPCEDKTGRRAWKFS